MPPPSITRPPALRLTSPPAPPSTLPFDSSAAPAEASMREPDSSCSAPLVTSVTVPPLRKAAPQALAGSSAALVHRPRVSITTPR